MLLRFHERSFGDPHRPVHASDGRGRLHGLKLTTTLQDPLLREILPPGADRGVRGRLHILRLVFPTLFFEEQENVLRHLYLSLSSTIRRISIPWPGHVFASATAASLFGSSKIENPPTDSFASMNGPSTTVALPVVLRIVVAVRVGCSSAPPSTIFGPFVSNHLKMSA